MSLLPGVFHNPSQAHVPCWYGARQQCQGKGLRGGAGEGAAGDPETTVGGGDRDKGLLRCCELLPRQEEKVPLCAL